MTVELWVEKYRPKTISQYVWRDASQKKKVEEWIAEGSAPHLLLSGSPGLGKTSLAELILLLMNIPGGDILKINASRMRHVEDIQAKIESFVSTWALGPTGIKYIILDEADALSPMSQRMLRGDFETYHDSCRFILTVNYPEKVIPAIHSRCQGFQFSTLDMDDFIARAGEILVEENVAFDVAALISHVEATYPDLRKCINSLQQSVEKDTLKPFSKAEVVVKDYLSEMVDLFKKRRFLDGRTLLCSQARPEEYPDIYRFLYQNLDLWGKGSEDDALIIIRQGLVNHSVVADPEINLAATIAELSRLNQ